MYARIQNVPLGQGGKMHYDIKIRLGQKEPSFGKGVVELLEGIEMYGSLRQSYTAMKMSSSKAWKILNRAQDDLGCKLVQTKVGGLSGGQTILTKEGKEYLTRYQKMVNEIEAVSDRVFEKYFGS